MPRKIPAEELDLIEQVITDHPNGIGISKLEKLLAPHLPTPLNRRAIQRRIKQLLVEKRIRTEGKSTALLYKSHTGNPLDEKDEAQSSEKGGKAEFYIPVSPEGAVIRDLVRQPIIHRKPVGYQHSFLDNYQPGVTFYIPQELRTQFHEMGRTPSENRPAGTYAREILNRLLIDLSWASSHLEGNTYNQLDTKNLIEFGQAAEGKNILETQMILNHKAAIEMLIEDAAQVGFNSFTFLNLHAILSENLLPDENACGRLRRRLVDISGSVFHPLGFPQVLENYFKIFLQKASEIPDPFEQAFFIMVQIPYLQPFEDVNKRVSRIGANIPLIKNNLCPLSFIDVPEKAYVEGTIGVYEFNQVDLLLDVFTWAYERSCQRYLAISKTVKEPDPLRIRYREELSKVVRTIVQNRQTPSPSNIQALMHKGISKIDKAAVSKMILNDLKGLHEGNVARYKLKLSEYLSWATIRGRYFEQKNKHK